jgi:hypothetical protein
MMIASAKTTARLSTLPQSFRDSGLGKPRLIKKPSFEFSFRLLILLISQYGILEILFQLGKLLAIDRQCFFSFSLFQRLLALEQRPQEQTQNEQRYGPSDTPKYEGHDCAHP